MRGGIIQALAVGVLIGLAECLTTTADTRRHGELPLSAA
jgi:hypothetical protein